METVLETRFPNGNHHAPKGAASLEVEAPETLDVYIPVVRFKT